MYKLNNKTCLTNFSRLFIESIGGKIISLESSFSFLMLYILVALVLEALLQPYFFIFNFFIEVVQYGGHTINQENRLSVECRRLRSCRNEYK